MRSALRRLSLENILYIVYLRGRMRALLTLLLVGATALTAQFSDVTVRLDIERLKQSEQQNLQGLKGAIQQFYLSSPWEQNIDDLDMVLDMQVMFQSTILINNERHYQAQILFTNRLDQLYLEKAAKFPYSPGRSLRLSLDFDPLASLLEFYAYFLIAGELDTYEVMAGSPYYSKAMDLAILGQNIPSVSRGWSDRIKLVERLTSNQELRRAKAYFYQAAGVLSDEEPDMEALQGYLGQFTSSIRTIVERQGQERHTTLFLTGHAAEIADMLAQANMWTELAAMAEFNPNAQQIYEAHLKR